MSSQHVSDVMTTKPVQVRPSTPVGEVAKLMRERNIGAVLVTEGSQTTGVVTDRDLVVRILANDRGPTTMVGTASTAHPLCLHPQDDVDTAIQTMRSNAVRRLPVTENGMAVGIVSLGDLAELRDRDSVLGEISSAEPNN